MKHIFSQIKARLKDDVAGIRARDPAASSDWEVILLYSGFHAVAAHRLSHFLHEKGHCFSARALSQAVKCLTGIEIHPAAKIGKRLFIDHGSGVVIGETAEIGDDCTIYQGVTLGGTGKESGKRHPTLKNGVTVGAGAKVLGPFTVGEGAKIGAGAVVLSEVPPHATAVGVPARIVRIGKRKIDALDQVHTPDPVAAALDRLDRRIACLEEKIKSQEEINLEEIVNSEEEIKSEEKVNSQEEIKSEEKVNPEENSEEKINLKEE